MTTAIIPPAEGPAGLILRYRRDPCYFIERCVKTQDQADLDMPVKRFPLQSGQGPEIDKDYLRYIITEIIKEPLLAVVKHRRMILTWAMCAVWTWDALFHSGRFLALVSKKEEDSDELVQRCKFIYDNIDEADLGFRKPRAEYKYTSLKFLESDSEIKGFAQGADQLRQRGCSRVGCDEMAFWTQARAAFVSLKPTIQGGGQILVISTRYPGFFKELIEDTLETAA